jgi:hypothetical protein
MSFVLQNPPYPRKRRIDGTYMMITADKLWEAGTEVFEWTSGGCVQNPAQGTYNTDDGLAITISEGKIQSIVQNAS